MTTAEIYRQKEASAVIQVARYIFNIKLSNSKVFLLGDLLEEIKTGKTPLKNEKKYYEDDFIDWYKPNEIGLTKYCKSSKEKLSKYAYKKKQVTVYSPNTILINAIGDIGLISILNKEASSNQQITGIKPNTDKINIEYCYYYLLANRHLFYKDLFKTTLPIINQKKIKSLPIVVPSVKQQEFIVDFLNTLENIDAISDLDKNKWGKEFYDIANKFFGLKDNNNSISSQLTRQLDLVKQLRQAFLREAMQGKLTAGWRKQNPDVEPASELLARIKAEKEQLIKDKKIKKQKPLPLISDNEVPFELPENWAWCRMGQIVQHNSGKTLHGSQNTGKHRKCITTSNLYWGYFELEKLKEIQIEDKELIRCTAQKGDLLICEGGESGRSAIWNKNFEICFQNHIHRVRPFIDVSNNYLYYVMLFLDYSGLINNYRKGMGISNLSGKSLSSILVPLCSYSEQQQIVTKLDELMAYCDQLEESIKNSQSQNEMILQQVLKEALEPEEKEV